jgi:hypothetical protein
MKDAVIAIVTGLWVVALLVHALVWYSAGCC